MAQGMRRHPTNVAPTSLAMLSAALALLLWSGFTWTSDGSRKQPSPVAAIDTEIAKAEPNRPQYVSSVEACNQFSRVRRGDRIDVDIVLGGGGRAGVPEGLKGFDYRLHFDTREVEVVSWEVRTQMINSTGPGVLDVSPGLATFGPYGRLHLVAARTGGTSPKGSGVLVRVTLQLAGQSGLSELFLTFQDSSLVPGKDPDLVSRFPERDQAGAFDPGEREGTLLVTDGGPMQVTGDHVRGAYIAIDRDCSSLPQPLPDGGSTPATQGSKERAGTSPQAGGSPESGTSPESGGSQGTSSGNGASPEAGRDSGRAGAAAPTGIPRTDSREGRGSQGGSADSDGDFEVLWLVVGGVVAAAAAGAGGHLLRRRLRRG